MEIKLEKHVEERLTLSVQRYIKEAFDEDAGALKASLLLRFCIEEIGPAIYNQAISDAMTYFQDRVADLENVCFVKDGAYWRRADAMGGRPKAAKK